MIHIEFDKHATITKEILLRKISEVKNRKGLFGECFIKIKTKDGNNYPIVYINSFLSIGDKIAIIKELNKRITANKKVLL
ncbi:hypothetical protein [Flagellimonas onchidii]|uniref:hypothetical protein n=1 Tax=Flagellimonas onchidii TaxID=2562684 RepID=UPI00197A7450|nr:hypothetical protein [Allomuricauda onchidii]